MDPAVLTSYVIAFAVLWWMAAHLLAPEPLRPSRTGAAAATGLAAVATAVAVVERSSAQALQPSNAVAAALVAFGAAVAVAVSAIGWRVPSGRRGAWVPVEAAALLAVVASAGLLVGLAATGVNPGLRVIAAAAMVGWGIVRAAREGRSAGQAWLPELVRSFDFSLFIALLFGGQVVLAMALSTGPTRAMTVLLLGVISLAIVGQTLWQPHQPWIERVAYARWPRLRRLFAETRAMELAQRVNILGAPLDELDVEAFIRLTRQALRHLGDVPRLARSPLIHLRAVEARIDESPSAGSALQRAAALQAILRETIARLRPLGDGEPEATREWRHFNALYYPYVVGLRPYSRRFDPTGLDTATRTIAAWMRAQVPERTLHNWQNEAAALIAAELRGDTPHLA